MNLRRIFLMRTTHAHSKLPTKSVTAKQTLDRRSNFDRVRVYSSIEKERIVRQRERDARKSAIGSLLAFSTRPSSSSSSSRSSSSSPVASRRARKRFIASRTLKADGRDVIAGGQEVLTLVRPIAEHVRRVPLIRSPAVRYVDSALDPRASSRTRSASRSKTSVVARSLLSVDHATR